MGKATMEKDIPDEIISELSEFTNTNLGLYFPKERWKTLRRGVRAATPELAEMFGIEADTLLCIDRLLKSRPDARQLDVLTAHLTVGETYFLRDKNLFHLMRTKILPEMVSARFGKEKTLRVWSAGCCTGEEPYSVSILIDQVMQSRTHWDISILGTDVNAEFLKKAKSGLYTKWSFRETPEKVKKRYFTKVSDMAYEISPCLKEIVKFSQLNLVEDDFPSPYNHTQSMDIILCRNVLIYFSTEQRKNVVRSFAKSLADDGWLIVSPSETGFVQHSELRSVNYSGAVLFRKVPLEKQPGRPETNKWMQKIETWGGQSPSGSNKWMEKIETLGQSQSGTNKWMKKVESWKKKSSRPTPPIRRKIETRRTVSKDAAPVPSYKDAVAMYDRGQYGQAARQLEKMLEPGARIPARDKARAMALLAKTLANLGKMDEALKWCRKAVQSDRINPGCHYLLATIYQELGRLDESAESLRRVIFLDSGFIPAHFALGNLARQTGHSEESAKHLKNALSLLSPLDKDEILPHGDGMTAGRLSAIVKSMLDREM